VRRRAAAGRRRGRERHRPALAALIAALALSALAGCRTAPPAPPTALSEYLPPEAAAYVYLDVGRAQEPARHILSAAGIEGRNARRILERTARVAVALGEPGAGEGAFLLAASGRLPGFLIEAQLEDEEEWNRRTVSGVGRRYGVWRREADGVELAFPEPRLAVVGTAGVEAALQRQPGGSAAAAVAGQGTPAAGAAARGAAAAERHTAVLFLPRTVMAAPLGRGGIELADVELLADPDSAGDAARDWRIRGRLSLADEGTARAVTALIRLLAISMIAQTGADPGEVAEELSVERDGTTVGFDGIILAERYVLDALDEFLLGRYGERP
ncbi:MAG: hypothetical protein GVY14_12320, partial [Spirochaetes bacterium]|nr:hypothetical protein [Spirochaetota bacterium]